MTRSQSTGRPHQGAGNSTRRWMITESPPRGGEEQNPAYRPTRPLPTGNKKFMPKQVTDRTSPQPPGCGPSEQLHSRKEMEFIHIFQLVTSSSIVVLVYKYLRACRVTVLNIADR